MTEPSTRAVAAVLDDLATRITELTADVADDAGRVDLLAGFENLKAVLEAAQARLAVGLDESTRQRHQAAGVPARRLGEGVAAQIALARRVSPSKGARLLSLAHTLVEELPGTLGLMEAGWLSEYRASIIARGPPASTVPSVPWSTPSSPAAARPQR